MATHELYHEEDTEMQHVNAIGQESNHRFWKVKDPPFYKPSTSREAKDAVVL